MLWTPHKAIFQTQKISHKNGAMEIWDIWAKMGPFWVRGAQKGPNTRSKWVVTMSPTQAGQWVAVGTKSGPPGPSKDCVIYAIPCNTMTNNQMQYSAMQYDAMQYHAKQSKTIQYLQYKEIPCNTLFKSFKTSTGPMGFVFSSWMVPYGL